MAPTYMARGLAVGRARELPAEAERRRLIAAVPAGPGAVQRFGLRVACRGRRPAVARRPAVLAPRAYGPLAI
ncbi:MAG TPA: hypothetical protein VMC03_15755 [Streptosporangiaceae bacterium]|nr:hypothetical protein [Streptosporangiaceae bacterium]